MGEISLPKMLYMREVDCNDFGLAVAWLSLRKAEVEVKVYVKGVIEVLLCMCLLLS